MRSIIISRSAENAIQTLVYCATEPTLRDQSGEYYSECAQTLTTDKAMDMADAYRSGGTAKHGITILGTIDGQTVAPSIPFRSGNHCVYDEVPNLMGPFLKHHYYCVTI